MAQMHGTGWLLIWACLAVSVVAKVDVDSYIAWLKAEKGYHFAEPVSVLENAKGHRQVVATKEIKDNFLIAKMPIASEFTAEKLGLTLTGLSGCDDTVLESLDSRSKLALAVLFELEVPDSKWKPYLDTLKVEDADFPVSWSAADTALLQGSGLQLKVLSERKLLGDEYKTLVEACPAIGDKVSHTQFMQVGGLVGSQGSGEESILPFFDLVNHDNTPNAEIGLVEDEGIYALASIREIREGEEVVVSYTDGPADLGTLARYGFLDDKPVANGHILFPACIPESLAEIAEAAKRVEGESFEGFSPELHQCCEESMELDEITDKACLMDRVRTPRMHASFQFLVGPIGKDGKQGPQMEGAQGDFAELLTRFRTLVQDSGALPKCSKDVLDPARPASMASEKMVMELFKTLLESHLDTTAWAAGKDKPPAPADNAKADNVQLVRKAMRVERGVFQWYTKAADFVLGFFDLYENDGPDALKKGLCERFTQKGKKVKGKLNDFDRYDWLVENILAPLAFSPVMEKDEPCSIKKASYKMKAKECKELLSSSEGHHSEL